MVVKVVEDISAVSTTVTSCSKREIKRNLGVSIGMENEKKDKNGAISPSNLSHSASLAKYERCEKWEDKTGMGGYYVELDVYRPDSPHFRELYSNLVRGHYDRSGIFRQPLADPVNLGYVPNHSATHPDFAKVVCLTRITTKDLSDAGSKAEINIRLSSSDFKTKLQAFWPRQASDCPAGSNYDHSNNPETRACSVPKNGGALDISNLCTSMYDENHLLGVRIREVDGGGSSDDHSMITILPKDLLPKMSSNGTKLTDQSINKFIQETTSQVPVSRTTVVEPSLAAKAGVTLNVGDHLSAGADLSMGAYYPQTSKWQDLPGGYTAYLSVYEKENSNYNYIYNEFAKGKWIEPTQQNSEHVGVILPSKAKVVCVNRITSKGLSDPGSYSEINISVASTNYMNIIKDSWPHSSTDCRYPGDFDSNFVNTCTIKNEGGAINIFGLCTLMMD